MNKYEGEYYGSALSSFMLALGHSQALIEKILHSNGVERIDPERWYELNWSAAFYTSIAKQVGSRAVTAVGMSIIETAPFPPDLKDVRDVLANLDAAYHMNARGPATGSILTSFDDERSATIVWTAPGPCALNVGIIHGCCNRFGARALIEHGATGCMERGASSCTYLVTW
jgi:hypothetical protein